MNTLRNNVQLIGHLGANPEVKSLANGSKKATMRLATTERYQVNGEWKEETQWHFVIAWDRIAERLAQHLQKGSYVLIEGKLVHRTYVTAEGEQKYITEIQLRNYIQLDHKPTNLTGKLDSKNEAGAEAVGLPF